MVLGLNYIKIFNTHGHSMQPAIEDDSLVVCIKTKEINSFLDNSYYRIYAGNNKLPPPLIQKKKKRNRVL